MSNKHMIIGLDSDRIINISVGVTVPVLTITLIVVIIIVVIVCKFQMENKHPVVLNLRIAPEDIKVRHKNIMDTSSDSTTAAWE